MLSTTVIGLDIGRSAVKVVAVHNGVFHRLAFPSIVSPAIEISVKDAADRAALETVTVAGKDYFTGDTAALQGRANMSSGLSDDWTETTPYLVLVTSAMKRLAQIGVPGLDRPYLVIGTPSKLHATHRETLAARTLQAVNAETVRVLPQPMGAFSSFALDSRGAAIRERNRDANGNPLTWAVVDIGHFTTDFLLMRKGMYVQHASVSCEGIHFAASDLIPRLAKQQIRVNHIQAEEVLRNRTVKHFGQPRDVAAEVDASIDTVVQTILMHTETLLSSEASNLDGILLAGGGAPLVFEALRKKWPNTMVVDDPRMAVADGYCKFGIGAAVKAATAEKTAGARA